MDFGKEEKELEIRQKWIIKTVINLRDWLKLFRKKRTDKVDIWKYIIFILIDILNWITNHIKFYIMYFYFNYSRVKFYEKKKFII